MRILFSGLLVMLSRRENVVERMNDNGCFEGGSLIRRFDFHMSSWPGWSFVAIDSMFVLECCDCFPSSKVLTIQRSRRAPSSIRHLLPRQMKSSLVLSNKLDGADRT